MPFLYYNALPDVLYHARMTEGATALTVTARDLCEAFRRCTPWSDISLERMREAMEAIGATLEADVFTIPAASRIDAVRAAILSAQSLQ